MISTSSPGFTRNQPTKWTSSDDIYAQRIRSLSLWSGPIRLQRLDGGITNRNYLVDDANEQFVARIGEELLVLGIDRRNELQCHRAAQSSRRLTSLDLWRAWGARQPLRPEPHTRPGRRHGNPGFAPGLPAYFANCTKAGTS